MKYAIVIEHGRSGYSAYVPDLPGCVAVARTRQEVERLIEEAIVMHVAGLHEDGLPVPPPQTEVATVDIADKV
jgi:predicted RNase H-like HicB family nuclease